MSVRSAMWLGIGVSALVGCTFEIRDERSPQPIVIAVDGAAPEAAYGGSGGAPTTGAIPVGGGGAPTGGVAGGASTPGQLGPQLPGTGGNASAPGSDPHEPAGLRFCAAKASTEVRIRANLDANSTVPTQPWDPQNAALTSNFSTALDVLDSLGALHYMEIYFRKTGQNAWEYHVLADGNELAPAQPGLSVEVGVGMLAFNSYGQLDAFTQATPVSVNFAGATAAQSINLQAGTPVAGGGLGDDGITAYAAKSNVHQQDVDGCKVSLAVTCKTQCEPI